jgi:hypothetical protein
VFLHEFGKLNVLFDKSCLDRSVIGSIGHR